MSKTHTYTRFPVITEVALTMAAANGAINRESSAGAFLERLDYVLEAEGVYEGDLRNIDRWLHGLTEDQRGIVADGEETEIEEVFRSAPQHAKGLFQDIFDDAVCGKVVEMITRLRRSSVHYSVEVNGKVVWEREVTYAGPFDSMRVRMNTAREQEQEATRLNDGVPPEYETIVREDSL